MLATVLIGFVVMLIAIGMSSVDICAAIDRLTEAVKKEQK